MGKDLPGRNIGSGFTRWQPGLLRHGLMAPVRKYPRLMTALQDIIDEIKDLMPGAMHRRDTGAVIPSFTSKEKRMAG